ncbi:hypothetical protein V9T40_007043 [Parthenolecanium corni]|uniref:Uncharacterized protein n=1 Tax=Parthenolecanium corni TaxID=536013 RepID=A0AAN9TY30_9HEMI
MSLDVNVTPGKAYEAVVDIFEEINSISIFVFSSTVFYKIHKNECKVQKTSGAIFNTSTLTTTERGTTIYTSAVPTDNEPVTQKNFSTTTEKEQAESSGVIFNTPTMTTTERGTTIYTSAVPTDNEPVTQKNFSTTTEKEQAEWGSLEEYLND